MVSDVVTDGSLIGLTGARFGGRNRRMRPDPVPPPVTAPARPRPRSRPRPVEEAPVEVSPYATVRPYVLTGGRTRAPVGFAVEALVSAVPGGRDGPSGPEHRRIVGLCAAAPRSVAELAALLGTPLGVVQVLVADLLTAGRVTVHRTVDRGGPDLALLERVLAGLHRL